MAGDLRQVSQVKITTSFGLVGLAKPAHLTKWG